MNRILILILLFTLLPCQAKEDESWVSNGQWKIRLVKAQSIDTYADYAKLPWTSAMKGEVKAKHEEHLKKSVYGKEKKVALITVEMMNLGAAPLKLGTRRPYWKVRLSDGQQVSNNHSFMTQSANLLQGGFPGEVLVGPKKKFKGTLAFYIPEFTDVNMLFFKANGRVAKDFGETESLVLKTQKKSVQGGRAAIGETNSKAPWVSNGNWKMRVTGSRWVNSLAEYKSLPFNDRLTGDKGEKHLKHLDFVYKKKKRVLLLQVELKNLTAQKQDVGVGLPTWFLGCRDKTEVSNNHSFMRQVSFMLEGGLPQKTILNPNDTVRGVMAFFVPKDKLPQELFFKAKGHVAKSFVGTRTIVMPLP